MLTLILLVLVFLFGWLTAPFWVWLAARRAHIGPLTYRRCLLLVVLSVLVLIFFFAGTQALVGAKLIPVLAGALLEVAAAMIAFWVVGRRLVQTTPAKMLLLSLVFLGVEIAYAALFAFVVVPHGIEFFIESSNSMAPTLVAAHATATCPRCQGALIVQPANADIGRSVLGICQRCLQSSEVMDPGFEVEPPDRVAVNKLLAPRRWDIIAFRWPQDPSYEYTKRVVGLPGEEVVIKEGGIWINGTRAEPPAQIASLRFTPGPDGLPEGISGSEKHPARLGMDEYFVVGDFALASSDSRVWRQGAPGHPPFAVPRGYIEGVVGLIYWPPARWRLFR